jgi:hypothetical protein
MLGLTTISLLAFCCPAPGAPLARVVERPEPPKGAPKPPPVREVTALPAGGPVKIDGVFDEPCWQTGLWVGGFTLVDSGGATPEAPTELKIRFDGDNLYLAVRATEANLAHLKESEGATHDAQAFYDDCVELWLDPDGLRRQAYHLVYSVAGGTYDALQTEERLEGVATAAPAVMTEEKSWEAHGEAAFRKGPDQWTCELRLPVRDFGLPSIFPGGVWALNVVRDRYAFPEAGRAEYSSLTGAFRSPLSRFADLQMGIGPVEVTNVGLGALGVGENRLQFDVRRLADGLSAVEACLTVSGKTQSTLRRRVALSREPQTVTLPYDLQGLGDFELRLELWNPDTAELLWLKRVQRRLEAVIRLWPGAEAVARGEPWLVDAELRVGGVSLPRTRLEVTVIDADGKAMATSRLKPPRASIRLALNLKRIKRPSDYRVVFTVFDGGVKLGEAAVPLRVEK